jgi:putative redox protein
MPTVTITRREGDYGFEATDEAGLRIRMDNSLAGGGHGYGVSPMQSLLMALGACSGIDVVLILNKQRQAFGDLSIKVSGEREQNREPALWKQVHMIFFLSGTVERAKTEHAVKLSIDKYCSVAETLRRAGCAITWEVNIAPATASSPAG